MSVKATKSINGADLEFGTISSDNPAAIASDAEGTAILAISGAKTADLVFVTARGVAAGIAVVEATVTDADEVTVKLLNATEGSIDDAVAAYDYMLVKVAA
jgi:hypothetical protein